MIRLFVSAVVMWLAAAGLLSLVTEPGPTRPTTLVARYGWAMVVGSLLAVVAVAAALWRPSTALAVLLVAVVVLVGRWGLTGRPVTVWRRVVLRSRWPSVARSAGLGVVLDRRSDQLGRPTIDLRDEVVEWLPVLSRGRAVPGGVAYRLRPARGATIDDVEAAAEQLAAGLRVEVVEVSRDRPDRGTFAAYWRGVPL